MVTMQTEHKKRSENADMLRFVFFRWRRRARGTFSGCSFSSFNQDSQASPSQVALVASLLRVCFSWQFGHFFADTKAQSI